MVMVILIWSSGFVVSAPAGLVGPDDVAGAGDVAPVWELAAAQEVRMDPMAAVSKVAATREVLVIGSPRWGAVAGPGWGRWSGGERDGDGLCQKCLCRGVFAAGAYDRGPFGHIRGDVKAVMGRVVWE